MLTTSKIMMLAIWQRGQGLREAWAYPLILQETCQIYVPEVAGHGLEPFLVCLFSTKEKKRKQTSYTHIVHVSRCDLVCPRGLREIQGNMLIPLGISWSLIHTVLSGTQGNQTITRSTDLKRREGHSSLWSHFSLVIWAHPPLLH
jgi:hypothetical protein